MYFNVLKSNKLIIYSLSGFLLLVIALSAYAFWARPVWSEAEIAVLRGLWLGSLEPLPPDASNQYADDPRAATLGQKLFFDTRFSSDGKVSCATCHKPELGFQDGKSLAQGVGVTNRRTMTIIGTAYSPWLFWDGRKDSLWAQALGPMESPVEHGGNRTQYAHLMTRYYGSDYEALFGSLPDLSHLPPSAGPVAEPEAKAAWETMTPADREAVSRIYANMGKAIAAYERKIMPGPTRFDAYVEAVLAQDWPKAETILTAEEVAGLKLFIGQANCTDCHNGPLLTNNDFHNTGVPAAAGLPEDVGRALGVQQALADEFNCLSVYSDTALATGEGSDACAELRFLVAEGHDLVRQFRPPSLRGVAERPPYMHAGQFASLEEVLNHYNTAPAAPAGHTELKPLKLSETELDQLIAFLRTLNGLVQAEPHWLQAPIEVSSR
jgi:cytochrome c peroxidase